MRRDILILILFSPLKLVLILDVENSLDEFFQLGMNDGIRLEEQDGNTVYKAVVKGLQLVEGQSLKDFIQLGEKVLNEVPPIVKGHSILI